MKKYKIVLFFYTTYIDEKIENAIEYLDLRNICFLKGTIIGDSTYECYVESTLTQNEIEKYLKEIAEDYKIGVC